MKSKIMLIIVYCLCGSALALAQDKLPRDVTSSEIPGVIAAGMKWQQVWQGLDNADSVIGTSDGGVLFAQEQPNTIRKLDKNDYDSAYVKNTEGTGSIWIDSKGRIVATQKTCTDPGRGDLPCNTPPKIGIVYPEKGRKVLVASVQGKPLRRPSEAISDKKDTVYFTDGEAYYLKPGGQPILIGQNLRAGGIMLSPDEKTLYIGSGPTIFAFE